MQPSERNRILLIAGTRPEVIKLAPLVFELERTPGLHPIFLSSGQHRQMLDQAFTVFGIKPDHDLNLMRPGQDLTALTARLLDGMGRCLDELRPAAVLVQGDTTTVLASALAAFYRHIPVGHVEAGLRTYDFGAPWPEEMNRRLVDPISRWCFAPTDSSAANLTREQIPAAGIHVTGNTVIDALLWVREKLQRSGRDPRQAAERCGIPTGFVNAHLLGNRPWVLVTGHRRESFGPGFEALCHGLRGLVERRPELGLLYPVHLNPKVQEPVRRLLGTHERIALIPPVGYEDFIGLMDQCRFVISDSGGVQEEAPSLGKPVLVTRDTTERPEGVAAGTCRLVGTDPDRIIGEATVLLEDESEYRRRSELKNPYGDGRASQRIVEVLQREMGSGGAEEMG